MPRLLTGLLRVLSPPIRLVPGVALAGGVAHFVVAGPRLALTRFPLDDAWIHQVYASALASGQGFAYNPGTQEAGFTSPLWVLLTAPATWLAPLGTDAAVLGVKVVGVILAGWVVWETAALGREWAGEAGGALAGTVIALEPRLVFSALSGMETLLAVGLWLAAARALRAERWRVVAASLALAPVARPELLVLWPLAALVWLVRRSTSRPRPSVELGTVALVALPLVGWSLYCLVVNGHPLPNTFYAKAHSALENPLVITGVAFYYLGQHGLLTTVAGWLAVAVFLGFGLRRVPEPGRPTVLLLVAGPFLYAFGVVLSRTLHPSGYYWTRWVDPAALVLTAAAGVGLAILGGVLARRWRERRNEWAPTPTASRLGTAFAVLVLGALVLQAGAFARSWQDRRTHLVSDARAIGLLNIEAGLWLREHAAPTDWIAVNDAGAIRLFSRRRTLDLVGLNTAPLALGDSTPAELMEARDVQWLAIFPEGFDDAEGRAMIGRFEPRVELRIPPEEYTVCDCPTQTRLVIYERRAGPPGSDGSGGSGPVEGGAG